MAGRFPSFPISGRAAPPAPPCGRRAAARVRLSLPATFISLDGNQRVVLENLSATGARLALQHPPPVGGVGYLQIEGIELFATAVWRNGARCGLVFDEEVPPGVLTRMRQLQEEYPEIAREAQRAAIREWVEGRGRIIVGA